MEYWIKSIGRLDPGDTVCEIGFAWGFGAYVWLTLNPNIYYIGFDIGER